MKRSPICGLDRHRCAGPGQEATAKKATAKKATAKKATARKAPVKKAAAKKTAAKKSPAATASNPLELIDRRPPTSTNFRRKDVGGIIVP